MLRPGRGVGHNPAVGTDVLRSRLLAILAADVAGYSRLMSLDERATVAALDRARAVFGEEILAHGGRVIDMAGDSVMSVFDSATGALQAALAVQRRLATADTALPDSSALRFRIGIHVGDVIEKPDGTVYGDGVNIAARLEGLAQPGAIALSQAVHGMVARRVPVRFEDLGEQRVKNIAQALRVYRVDPRQQPAAAQALLPAMPSPEDGLIGREDLIEQACTLLGGSSVRLLTLTGPGGTGKTSVGQRATKRLAPRMADGACLVLLAPVREAGQVMTAVAAALGLQEGGAESPAALVRAFLRPREMLLTLDNLEHLPQAAPLVADLLQACPRLRVLATSRVLLHLSTEHELKVPPLALPASDEPAALVGSPAVALLVTRAAALGRDLRASDDDLKAAAQICRRLDGLPLAIELAAARLRTLSPAALAARLHHSLPLLKAGTVDLPERQQTLRAAIAWSHDLLAPPVQRLFNQLGVFAGGWSLEGAQALGGDGDVLDGLDELIDHNLVQRAQDVAGQPRFVMLETIREYALERLTAADELAAARDSHARHLAALAFSARDPLTSAARQPWLLRLRAEINNFRDALHWLVRERADAPAALGLAGSLTWLWYFDGLYREGRHWMDEALALPGALDHGEAVTTVMLGMARLSSFGGDMVEAHRLCTEAAARCRQAGDVRGLAFGLLSQGVPTVFVHGRDAAAAVLRESRLCFVAAGDVWGTALATVYEGVVLAIFPGAEDAALLCLNEGVARCRVLGDDWAASTGSFYIGAVAQRRGDWVTARRNMVQGLDQARATGDRFRIGRGAYLLGELSLLEGGHDAEALALMAEAAALALEQSRSCDVPQIMRMAGRALSRLGRHAEAALLLGNGAAPTASRPTLPPEDAAALGPTTDTSRLALGEDLFNQQWQQGLLLTPEQAADRLGVMARSVTPAA